MHDFCMEQHLCRTMDQQSRDAIERASQLDGFLARDLANELTGLGIDDANHGASRARIDAELHAVVERFGRAIDRGNRFAHALHILDRRCGRRRRGDGILARTVAWRLGWRLEGIDGR